MQELILQNKTTFYKFSYLNEITVFPHVHCENKVR